MSRTRLGVESLLDRLRIADCLAEEGRNVEALDVLQDLERESSHPRDVSTVRLKRVIVLTNMGDLSEAQAIMASIRPELLSEEYLLAYKFETGRIEAARGESDNAIMVLTQALRDAEVLKPKGDLAFIRDAMIILLGKLLCDTGQPARAIPLLDGIRRSTPGWERAYRILGDCYFQLSRYREAVKVYRKVAEASEHIAELERNTAIRNLGSTFFYMRDFRQAARYLTIAADKFREFPALKEEIEELLRSCHP